MCFEFQNVCQVQLQPFPNFMLAYLQYLVIVGHIFFILNYFKNYEFVNFADVVENGPVPQHHLQSAQNHQTHCLPQIVSGVQVY